MESRRIKHKTKKKLDVGRIRTCANEDQSLNLAPCIWGDDVRCVSNLTGKFLSNFTATRITVGTRTAYLRPLGHDINRYLEGKKQYTN